MKTLVLGAGKMMEAILIGLRTYEDFTHWGIYSPSGTSAKNLALKVGAKFVADLDEVNEVQYVFVACKPQQLRDLKATLGERFASATFVSILAALPESTQREILQVNKLVRVMPNLPVEFQKGVSLLSSQSAKGELEEMVSMFSNIGLALSLSEDELEELTLLTGSGPAFFYEFAANMAASFTSLDQEQREKLARQVLLGAATAAQKSPQNLTEMTSAVTSKGGVTIAVLEKWRELNFIELIKKGITRGKERSSEIKSLLQK